MKSKSVLYSCLVLVVLLATIIGCSSPQPTATQPTSPQTSAATSTAPPAATTQAAQSAKDFFNNNTLTVVVNGGVGSTTDIGARVFASYWAEVTGGKPMMVKVMSGGGGIEGLNYVYSAKPDGLTIGVTTHSSDITTARLLGMPGVTWDTRDLGWLGWFGTSAQGFALSKKAPWKTVADMKAAPEVVFGTANPGSGPAADTIIAIELFGLTKAKVLFGYDIVDLKLAAQRGEVDGYGASLAVLNDHEKIGSITPFCTLSTKRSAWYPNLPAITELVKPTAAQEDLVTFVEALNGAKSFFTPPGIAPDKLAYLRTSFDAVIKNESFMKLIKATFPTWETPATGPEVETFTNKVLSMSPERVKVLRDLFNKYVK